ncbi:pentapeptide repeat-containing protein [Saccharothrix sp. Mg75]|uniref:pentapeptide repeat-containing protein n=1 Tax=Saccharothrix sp. Mg75 TaxID=3445357 RepID=UPI003EEE7112
MTPRSTARIARVGRLHRSTGRRKRSSRGDRSWNWTAVASVLAAVAAVGGVVFTGLSLQATRAQIAVAEQGQLTDRFTKAVDQLDRAGVEHLQARLGALYALERLARDSPRDQPTVIEVVSAFVRGTAPPRRWTYTDGFSACPSPELPLAIDVQAALDVLVRRDTAHDQETRADLTGVCLARADLAGADFRGADFTGTSLDRADLTDADLRGANLSQTILDNADLIDADLTGADLRNATVWDLDLSGATLSGAKLFGVDLHRVRHDSRTVVDGVLVDERTQNTWWR